MWSKKAISRLNIYFPPCGSCMFCGHKDKRHRLWDVIIAMDNSDESIASVFDIPIESVKLVRQIRPYHRNNFVKHV